MCYFLLCLAVSVRTVQYVGPVTLLVVIVCNKRVNWFPSYAKGCRDGSLSNYSFVCVSSVNGNPKDAARHSPHPAGYWSQKQRGGVVPFLSCFWVLVGWKLCLVGWL